MKLVHNEPLLESYMEKNAEQLFMLVKGKATVSYVAENGKKLIVSFMQAFELLGDMEYIKQMDALHTVEAASEVHLIGI
ncbi:cyclic nucleotide-binding domain-containing protein [Terribacillus saccharophilus]|uniref:cyclic nucleotide-binding domain-containing protein n=1 Tax=Terribacillus saccharophilus TaxID=361277 RepID=UPI003981F3F1